MKTDHINKSHLAFRLLGAAGLISFAAWSSAQIPPGWTPNSDGGCLKFSNRDRLSRDQYEACIQAKFNAEASSDQPACKALGGNWIKTSPQGKGECGFST